MAAELCAPAQAITMQLLTILTKSVHTEQSLSARSLWVYDRAFRYRRFPSGGRPAGSYANAIPIL
jgi:hypothetical protein